MELLPLVLVLLAGTLATGIEEIVLDMAPNSFDDQYLNCRPEMWKKLPVLHLSEVFSNSLYAQVWAEAAAKWPRPLGTLQRREEAIALLAYTMAQRDLYTQFNSAVREGGRSLQHYLNNFDYKAMHFLLTEALGDLRKNKSHPACLHVYRGIKNISFTAKPGQIIRFGQFASSSREKSVSEDFGTDTFFNVYTCHGAMIQDFSAFPGQKEVLIPPFETFKVTDFKVTKDGTCIQLHSYSVHSKYSCAWLRGSSTHSEPPSLSGLLLAALAMAVATSTL
ncbi:erythroblast NAD(P)(+)--arginine ADP-ribosyltransferase-like [Pithys albifrons albifrons]|uniref:erythroblast NAD(P)(+)--arginine ADP-ribosyltransferase-like n=1 Tax=Pithys albifrons albifrons TaxID=3385563 RepID=UPI003A5CEF97